MSVNLKNVLIRAYPEINIQNLISRFSRNQIAGFHRDGFMRCAYCGFMIKIEETHCRLCSNKFRSTVRNAKKRDWVYSEPVRKAE